MSDLAKMDMPGFIKTFCTGKIDDKHIKVAVRINPMSISSYAENGEVNIDGESTPVTLVYVGGSTYNVCMSIKEVDEMMENIERGMSIKEG